MRISDWSSDVCSSDLQDHRCDMNADERQQAIGNRLMKILVGLPRVDLDAGPQHRAGCNEHGQHSERPQRIGPDRAVWRTRTKFPERKSVVWGKGLSVRVVLGGRGSIKKKKR